MNTGTAFAELAHREQIEPPALLDAEVPDAASERYLLGPKRLPLQYGPAQEQGDGSLTWQGVTNVGDEFLLDSNLAEQIMPPELIEIVTSGWLEQVAHLPDRPQGVPVAPLAAYRANRPNHVVPPSTNTAVLAYFSEGEEKATIIAFYSRHASTRTFVMPGTLSRQQVDTELVSAFPGLMRRLTNAHQDLFRVARVEITNTPENVVTHNSLAPAASSMSPEEVSRPEPVERVPHRPRKEQLRPVRAMLGRVAAGIKNLRLPQLPEQLRDRRVAGTLGGVAILGAVAASVASRNVGDISTYLPAARDLLSSLPLTFSHGIAEAASSNVPHVPVDQFIPRHPVLKPQPIPSDYVVLLGRFNSNTDAGTLWGVATNALHRQGVAHPGQTEVQDAISQIVARNKHKLAGVDPTHLSRRLRLKIPYFLAP